MVYSTILWGMAVVALLNAAVLAAIFIVKFLRERKERAGALMREYLTEALIPFLESEAPFSISGRHVRTGEYELELPKPDTHAARVAVSTIVSFIGALKGEGQVRLTAMLESAGYVASVASGLKSRSHVQRTRAAMLLGGMHAHSAREALRAAFERDPSPEVRIIAAEALGEMGDAPSVPLLFDAIRQPTRYQELRIASVLSRLGVAAIPELERALGDADERIVRLSLDILIDIGMVIDAAPVVAALRHPSAEVRARAAELLGACGAVDAIGDLTVAAGDSAWFVRVRVVKALTRLGVPDRDDAAREWHVTLARLLDDDVWHVRRNAAAALAAGGELGRAMLELHAGSVSSAALQLHALRRGEFSGAIL